MFRGRAGKGGSELGAGSCDAPARTCRNTTRAEIPASGKSAFHGNLPVFSQISGLPPAMPPVSFTPLKHILKACISP